MARYKFGLIVLLASSIFVLEGCASTSKADRLRENYLSSGVRVGVDTDCEGQSPEDCQCVAEAFGQLVANPDDQSLIEAEKFVRVAGLGDGRTGASRAAFAMMVGTMLVTRAEELCGVTEEETEVAD
ncbi:hypothetical protein [Parvularcula dongshanensis]|uniref:Uncharacterized protein n=1 Tax=Parvularcula dongshanensis TaxID=1173995 RepID=A0A840I085_9PROT|nr:hypothetical protein [Parvularcula dongshanensis]MBB4657755.1 hypothetical protein [Parvularcula dongshanensis]